MPDSIPDSPSHDDIRTVVERVTASEVFARSPQLGAFLRFVVDATLRGKADRIKAYTIGVEVLRRDTSFDPQLDPIVRVEATRLRRALERYYAGPGADDAVIVDLPRGSYVPTFRWRERPVREEPQPVRSWSAELARPSVLAAVGALAVLGVSALLGLTLNVDRAPTGTIRPSAVLAPPSADTLPPGNGMPSILIDMIRTVGQPGPGALAAELLQAKVSDAFARFDTVNVVAAGAATPTAVSVAADLPQRYSYRLSGTVEYAGASANVWFTLTDAAEGTVVWSRTFEQPAGAGAAGKAEETIVIALTNALLQSYGVIRSRDRAKHMVSAQGDPRYRCVLEAADAIRTGDRGTHDRARACLEHLTVVDPSFATGFTFLAMTYNREFQLGYPPRAGDPPALERALSAARQGVNLHPENSRGYLALMVVQFNRRDIAAALAAGDKCRTLNEYDMLALGEYGGRLVLSGDIDRGLRMLADAGASGAVRPSWHHIYLFLGHYIGGDLAQAAYHARQIPTDQMALGQVAKALGAYSEGQLEQARGIADELARAQPGWRTDTKSELARLIADSGMIERLARGLADLGLAGGS